MTPFKKVSENPNVQLTLQTLTAMVTPTNAHALSTNSRLSSSTSLAVRMRGFTNRELSVCVCGGWEDGDVRCHLSYDNNRKMTRKQERRPAGRHETRAAPSAVRLTSLRQGRQKSLPLCVCPPDPPTGSQATRSARCTPSTRLTLDFYPQSISSRGGRSNRRALSQTELVVNPATTACLRKCTHGQVVAVT